MNNKENKIILFVTLGIIGVIIIILGATYAYWRLTKEQTGVNIVNSACLNVTMENQLNDIYLPKAYPISDSDGLQLEPFTFTVKNNCEEYADYTISLEMLNVTDLSSDFVKIALNEVGASGIPKILGSYDDYEDLKLEDTKEGRTITSGKLKPNGEKNYELRIWLDGDVEVTDDAMNKTYKSKVVIESTIGEEPKAQFPGKAIPLAEEGKDGLYEVEHNNLSEIGSEWNKTEYRYAGVNPNNYVEFNNEKWRIIGLVNVKVPTEDGSSKVEQRVKIIRTDRISGQKDFSSYTYYYDYNRAYNWTKSTLKDMLNGIYYNSKNGKCYAKKDSTVTQNECDFSGSGELPKGLDDTARQMIDSEVIWNIGGTETAALTADVFYERERGTSTYGTNPAEWTKDNDSTYHNGIGLMYPSDFGYATSGGEIGRETCLNEDLYHGWYANKCGFPNWLQFDGKLRWTITPVTTSNVTVCKDYGYLTTGNSDLYLVPACYLNQSTTISDGDGSFENPFKLSVN